MALVDIHLDLKILICSFLHPSDIFTLRKTCKSLELVTRQRTVWVDALRRICLENTLFLPSFPIFDMSDAELEQAAIAPRRWNELATSFLARVIDDSEVRLPPTASRIINDPFESKQPIRLVLVPGGRYLVCFSKVGLRVWDLGYTSSAGCRLIASVEPEGGSFSGGVHTTPDGMGLVICSLRRFQRCSFYEIYPKSETPQLTKIARLDLLPQYTLHDYVSPDKMIWFQRHLGRNQKIIFRVWDYRLNASASFIAVLGLAKLKHKAKVVATHTAIIILHSEGILIWAIPPLLPRPPDFNDYSLAQLPPVIRLKFSDGLSLHPPLDWKIMSSWYSDPSKPLYFDKVYTRHSQLQRFKIIIKSDFSDATLHFINTYTIRLPTDYFHLRTDSMFCEDTLVSTWASRSDCGIYTGSALSGPTLHGQILLAVDKASQLSICPASGRLVYLNSVRNRVREIIPERNLERHTDKIVVLDLLPHQRL